MTNVLKIARSVLAIKPITAIRVAASLIEMTSLMDFVQNVTKIISTAKNVEDKSLKMNIMNMTVSVKIVINHSMNKA
jgi:hypothetical protein